MNKLILSAAGSGKTTYLVNRAKEISNNNVLLTTYTEENEDEIKQKFKGSIPSNVVIQTWFSFLLEHGVRPYQSVISGDLATKHIGFVLVDKPSGFKCLLRNGNPFYWPEDDYYHFYFTHDYRIYSDKISKFIFECNARTGGLVIARISRIFPNIYIDEVQDLAGWDLEIIKLLLSSPSNIILVGDPRQVTYQTNHARKYEKYRLGKMSEFITNEYHTHKGLEKVEIDEVTLITSHRNNAKICSFANRLYPDLVGIQPCECDECRNRNIQHEGIFLVKPQNVDLYLKRISPMQLRWSNGRQVNPSSPSLTFGKSKGKTFEHVIIYPTNDMARWVIRNKTNLTDETRAKYYVAITRAKHSVAIVMDFPEDFNGDDIIKTWQE
jgi:DNA helicase II / ATP-dependent DNA helicase PcrA